MCGNVSAISLEPWERRRWPELRERLRVPDRMMGLMRGLIGEVEVAVVIAVTLDGVVTPVAIVELPQEIRDELVLAPDGSAKVGDYDVRVLTDPGPDGRPEPVALLATGWIDQHLLLYARRLWWRRPADIARHI